MGMCSISTTIEWQPAMSLPSSVNAAALPHVAGVFNFVAFFAILIVTAVLVIGIKESANLNSAIVIVKLTIVGIFLVLGGMVPASPS